VAVASRGPDILLVRYPCINENALCKVYPGHSETVRSMRFTFNRRNLISIGGSDNSIFIWNHSLEDEQASDDDDEVDDTPEPSILKLSPHVSHIMPPQRPVFSAPTDATTFTSATDVDLDLSWIHGFQGADRNNVMINTDGALVYPAAAVVVSYSKSTGKQRFLHGIHKNAITCLCIHPSGHIFASGEKGDVSPLVIVWGDKDMDILWRWESLHTGGVGQVAFNPRGDLLAALGCDATVSISNWSQGVVLLHVPCNYGVSCMHFLPPEEPSSTHDILAFGGSFCMKFWEVKGRQYSTQRGLWKHSHHCTVTAIASLVPGICVTGTLSGQLLLWNKHRVILDITNPLQAVQASIYPHKGAIYALCATFGRLVNDGISTELDISIKKVADNVRPPSLFSSDSHGNIALWHLVSEPDIIRTISHSSTQGALSKDAYGSSYTLRLMKTFNISILDPKPLDVCIHSLARNEQRLYVSTRGGDMYEIASDSIATSVSPVTSLLSSRILSVHGGSGELTGLATHPLLPVYFTSGDDRLLRCWSLTTHELISCLRLKVFDLTQT
jgi:WD40 repeat protein